MLGVVEGKMNTNQETYRRWFIDKYGYWAGKPGDIYCRTCDGMPPVRCSVCSDTGREPIPFSEVWGI